MRSNDGHEDYSLIIKNKLALGRFINGFLVLWPALYHNHVLRFYSNAFATERQRIVKAELFWNTPLMAFPYQFDEDGNTVNVFNSMEENL